jgi:peptidoglycan/LPS O-acetylase OafA/YrhL
MNAPQNLPTPTTPIKLDLLLFFDGVAISLIVLFHTLNGEPDTMFYPFRFYSAYLGLTLFTFSAGYKLILNHAGDLRTKTFLGAYFIRRFIRLYKPYLGYTLLIFVPLLIIDYCAWYILDLHFAGISAFFTAMGSMNIYHFLNFFIGDNPVTGHLWYLLALIMVTAVVFTLLYFLDLQLVFYLCVPLFLISLCIFSTTDFFAEELSVRAFVILPFFIFGTWYAFHQQDQKSPWFKNTSWYPALLFPILIPACLLMQDPMLKMVLVFFLCILFPFFLSSVIGLIKMISPAWTYLMFSGTYSFQIYLFHLPLILLILLRFTGDILGIRYFFMPFVITLLAMVISVLAYLMVRKVHLEFLIEG